MVKYHVINMDDLENLCKEIFGDDYAGSIADRDVLVVRPEGMLLFIGLWTDAQVEAVQSCLVVRAGLVDVKVSIELLMELLSHNQGPVLWQYSAEPIESGNRAAVYLEGTQVLASGMTQEFVQSYITSLCKEALEIRQWLISTTDAKKLVLEFHNDNE